MSVYKNIMTLTFCKGSQSDTDILSFQQNNQGSYRSLQDNGWGTTWFSTQIPPVQEHIRAPPLWQRWLIAASRLKLSVPGDLLCLHYNPSLIFHPSPSKPSLRLLPPIPHTPTACFSIWRSLQGSWMQHVTITALNHWSQLPWDKRKVGKIREVSVLKRMYIHSEIMDFVQLKFNSYKGK